MSAYEKASVRIAMGFGLVLPIALSVAGTPVSAKSPSALVAIVVAGNDGSDAQVANAVMHVGGRINRRLSVIHGVAASVPADSVGRLRGFSGVRSVTLDSALRPWNEASGNRLVRAER